MLVDVHTLELQYLLRFLLRSVFGILYLGRGICLTPFALMNAYFQEDGNTLTILITVHPVSKDAEVMNRRYEHHRCILRSS